MTIRAEPFSPLPVEKFSLLLDGLVQHTPWYHDYLDTPEKRREAVIAYLVDANANGKLWECWDDDKLVGVLLLNELVPFLDARCHFVFLDSKLANKAGICVSLMRYAFEQIPVEVLRCEIPTYAKALLKFARKLGFRGEAEGREYSWPTTAKPLSREEAIIGSRKHKGTLYKGEWHDVLMLSITKEEFYESTKQNGGSGTPRDTTSHSKANS